MSIEDKLKDIVWTLGDNKGNYTTEELDEVIADIMQAFKDEGYSQLWVETAESKPGLEVKQLNRDVVEQLQQHLWTAGYMTGQEWHERFEEEMSKVSEMWRDGSNGFVELRIVDKAARNAAGIKDE